VAGRKPLEEMLNDHGAGSSDDLKGLDILLVEDSWAVGDALKQLLEFLGVSVSGPAATTAEAERPFAQHLPDVALVDVHLRGGEQSGLLVTRLIEQSVAVIVLTGSPEVFTTLPAEVLEKPVSEAALLAHLRPLIAKKTTR
jgi:CheY-like chemotaxis protein